MEIIQQKSAEFLSILGQTQTLNDRKMLIAEYIMDSPKCVISDFSKGVYVLFAYDVRNVLVRVQTYTFYDRGLTLVL